MQGKSMDTSCASIGDKENNKDSLKIDAAEQVEFSRPEKATRFKFPPASGCQSAPDLHLDVANSSHQEISPIKTPAPGGSCCTPFRYFI